MSDQGIGVVLPIRISIVLSSVRNTQDAAMRSALKKAKTIYPEGSAA